MKENKKNAKTQLTVDAGSPIVIDKTIKLANLKIADGAVVTAPQGFSLTMTVNGVETQLKPGKYQGKIVLTPAENIIVEHTGHGETKKYQFRSGIYVDNGKYIATKSVTSAVAGGEVTGTTAKDIKITSVGEKFNGIIVTGDSKYTISNVEINLTGNGGNDFAGFGAAIMTDGNADLTVNNAKIITNGVIRSAAVIKGHSTLRINNSFIHTSSPPLPDVIEGMMQVPWMLGLVGTCRSTNLLDYGTAYYNNTHIVAEGWGALSTDATKTVRMNLKDCTIDVKNSGYGSYSIGDSVNTFDHCTFNVADMAVIMANETAEGVFTNGTVVNSSRFGVMMHGNMGTLTIDKGSIFNCKDAVIQVKSSYPSIIVDNARLNSDKGVILEVIVNDDPNMGGGGPPGGGPPGGGPPGGGPPGGGHGGPGGPVAVKTGPVNATFKNTTLAGDIINAMTTLADVNANFEKASLIGAITTATSEAAGPIDKEHYYNIGRKIYSYSATDNKYGVKVSLDATSKWIVAKTSYLTGLVIANGAEVAAPAGYRVTMTVNGVTTPIKAGNYTGTIALIVTPV